MSRFSDYGSTQRLGFALLLVGFCLCVTGCFSPFWIVSEVNLSDVAVGFADQLGDAFGRLSIVKLHLGIWWFCLDFGGLADRCYTFYEPSEHRDFVYREQHDDDQFAWINLVRFLVAINIKVTFICLLVACCRCCCCRGGRTICHGIMSFIAGAFGLIAVGLMASKQETLIFLKMTGASYGWSFGLYIAGCGVLVFASLLLCFARDQPTTQGMLVIPSAGPFVAVTHTTQAHVNQYELNGQVQAFERLPEPRVLSQYEQVYQPA